LKIIFYLSIKAVEKGNQSLLKIMLVAAGLLCLIFVGVKVYEYGTLEYNWAKNAYTSIIKNLTRENLTQRRKEAKAEEEFNAETQRCRGAEVQRGRDKARER
jgi:hypothetical protein